MVANIKHMTDKQDGFTLLELLIAIAFLAIGLSATAAMQAVAINGNSVANKVSVASFLAQQIAEEISSRDISDPSLNTAGNGPYMFVDWSSGSQQIVSQLSITGAGIFTATYNIQPNWSPYSGSLPGLTGSTEITVNVTATNPAYTATYTTYKMVQ
jgi:prepilin-type N-terminal cleavage/methylation domain-containing protein